MRPRRSANGSCRCCPAKGTLRLNLSRLNKAANNASPSMNNTSCSFVVSVSAPVTIVSGTGAYVGAHGTLIIHETCAAILPRLASGKCNEAQSAVPVAQWDSSRAAALSLSATDQFIVGLAASA